MTVKVYCDFCGAEGAKQGGLVLPSGTSSQDQIYDIDQPCLSAIGTWFGGSTVIGSAPSQEVSTPSS